MTWSHLDTYEGGSSLLSATSSPRPSDLWGPSLVLVALGGGLVKHLLLCRCHHRQHPVLIRCRPCLMVAMVTEQSYSCRFSVVRHPDVYEH